MKIIYILAVPLISACATSADVAPDPCAAFAKGKIELGNLAAISDRASQENERRPTEANLQAAAAAAVNAAQAAADLAVVEADCRGTGHAP